ncbi:hypothetical protein CCR75_003875 [Bremia lactucae]|uniref:Uncharacterized protein n=1 Tax=Bremia lactucae TaxID=4779 RepID=A0A976IHW4_BRELC|nr:hypothetical protein CCR75_003875 [Bremia lactucae]
MDITSAFGVYGNPVPLDPEEMASFVNESVVTYVRENPDVMIQTDCASQMMEKLFVTSAVFENYAVDARKLQTHWENVQDEWIDLFIDEKADYMVEKKLKQAQSYVVGMKALMPSDIQRTLAEKVILLVVDEARHLLDEDCTIIMKNRIVNDLSLLRRALVLMDNQIVADGGIFGVLIDTSLKIADFTPSIAHDSSSRNERKHSKVSFPSFC